MIWNINNSYGSWLIDNTTNNKYLDFHGGFGSNPIGWNHPQLYRKMNDRSLLVNKPANSDFYTPDLINFVDKFRNMVVPKEYPHLFFIDGGSLAVENALKVAMDWKCQKEGKDINTSILHFTKAFHGRSGYTLSLTNTDTHKVKNFTKFNWPRVLSPINGVEKDDDVALNLIDNLIYSEPNIAAIIIEPIQCEGGDRYFSEYFLQSLQKKCKRNDILFILDEIQTGFFTTGKTWCFQHYDLDPDIVCFGKKTQQCGIFAGKRIDEVNEHCFNTSSRINSTWGGNLVDMVRSSNIIDIIYEDKLYDNATERGNEWYNGMKNIRAARDKISNIRNLGLIMAFDCKNTEKRDALLDILRKDEKLLALSCGDKTVRFRPNLAVSSDEVQECIKRLENGISKLRPGTAGGSRASASAKALA